MAKLKGLILGEIIACCFGLLNDHIVVIKGFLGDSNDTGCLLKAHLLLGILVQSLVIPLIAIGKLSPLVDQVQDISNIELGVASGVGALGSSG